MKKMTPEQLVGKLTELCNITPNKLNHELPAHYREIDTLKDKIVSMMKENNK